jgi:hypothetical protein
MIPAHKDEITGNLCQVFLYQGIILDKIVQETKLRGVRLRVSARGSIQARFAKKRA